MNDGVHMIYSKLLVHHDIENVLLLEALKYYRTVWPSRDTGPGPGMILMHTLPMDYN